MGGGDRRTARGPWSANPRGDRSRAARSPRPRGHPSPDPTWQLTRAPQVAANRTRALEIDGLDQPVDARAIVLGGECEEHAASAPLADSSTPSVLWEGSVEGYGTGPQKSYF